MANRNLPIGIFDSGLGGLSALREVRRVLPDEQLIYFGDTGRVPYGTRSRETIIRYAKQDVRFLLKQNIKCIVVACGTVSAAALDILQDSFDIPILGVIEPAVAAAVQETKNGKIAVIATPSTIQSGAYAVQLEKTLPGVCVTQAACPLFVPLVENGFSDPNDPVPMLVAERYLQPVRACGADTLILGCTHYPLLAPVIHKILPDVRLIDTGVAVAHALRAQLTRDDTAVQNVHDGGASYFVSDTPESFEKLAGVFLGDTLQHKVTKISIEEY